MSTYRVEIILIKGEALKRMDFLYSDPYCIVKLADKAFSSPVIKNTLNPEWNFQVPAVGVTCMDTTIRFDLYDRDQVLIFGV